MLFKKEKKKARNRIRSLSTNVAFPESLEDRRMLAGEAVISESVFDPALFAQNLEDTYSGNVVGFAASINAGGQINAEQATGGFARTAAESGGEVSFDVDSEMTIASVAKTITATAILRILQDQGISENSSISPYLPSDWFQGPNISSITFRDLLTHESGIRRVDFNGSGVTSLSEQTSYNGLRLLIGVGIDGQNANDDWVDQNGDGQIIQRANIDDYAYENANFALMRVMLGRLWDGVENDHIESPVGALLMPQGVRLQVISDWGTLFSTQEQLTASIYKHYVKQYVFAPMGIVDVETRHTGNEASRTRTYPFPDDGESGFAWGDRTLLSGGEGWYLSARQLATFQHHIYNTNLVLGSQARELMQGEFLGVVNPINLGFGQGLFGTYFTHGGDLNNLNTAIAAFPNNVQASLLINSDMDSDLAYQLNEVKRAYENAWTEVTIEGTSGEDTFIVEMDDDGNLVVNLNGNDIARLQFSTLDRLTLRGRQGNDTFNIFSSHHFDLELEGNHGDDIVNIDGGEVADWDTSIFADVSFDGGSGTDALILDDSGDTLADDYIMDGATISKSSVSGEVTYSHVESLELTANDANNLIDIDRVPGNTEVTVNAGGGADYITLDNTLLFSPMTINAENGADEIYVSDIEVHDPLYLNGNSGADEITLDTLILRDEVTLRGHSGSDTLAVRATSLFGDGEVDARGDAGSDTLTAIDVSGSANTRLSLDGGTQGDDIRLDGSTGELHSMLWGDRGVDTIRVLSASSENTTVGSGDGDDVIRVGGGDISANLAGRVYAVGGDGEDVLVLEDRNGAGSDDFYILHKQPIDNDPSNLVSNFTKSGFGSFVWHDGLERVTLKGTQQDSTTNIRALDSNVTLNVNMVGGEDTIDIHSTESGSRVNVNGGDGNDQVRVSPTDRNLGLVEGDIHVDSGDGTSDRLYFHDHDSTGNLTYTINGIAFTNDNIVQWTFANSEDIYLHTNEYNNRVNINAVSDDVHLRASTNGGNDNVRIANSTHDLDSAIRGDLSVFAGIGGRDRIYLLDGNDEGADSYTFSGPSTFEKNTTSSWAIVGFENYRLYANQDSNSINVSQFGSLAPGFDPRLNIYANNGNDQLNVGTAINRIDLLWDDVYFHGGNGSDGIFIDDTMGTARDYRLSNGVISSGELLGDIRHTRVENVTIDASAGDDSFRVVGNRSYVSTTLDGNGGADSFDVATATEDLNQIQGELYLTGGTAPAGQQDSLTIRDNTNENDNAYTVNRASPGTANVSRIGSGTIRLASIDETTLLAGTGNDTIDIPSFIPNQSLNVNSGEGNDLVNLTAIGTTPGLGGVSIRGNGGDHDVLLYNDPTVDAAPYVITEDSIARDDGAVMPVSYLGIEELKFSVDQGNNNVTIESTNPRTEVSVSTGGGDDEVIVRSPVSEVTVNAGGNLRRGDRVTLMGTNAFDTFRLFGETINLGDGSVRTINVESRVIDGRASLDRLDVNGVGGVDEAFVLQPSRGEEGYDLRNGVHSDVLLLGVPRVRVAGNQSDDDALTVFGSDQQDTFDISMGAAGTIRNPVLVLQPSTGHDPLVLFDFVRVRVPSFIGLNGADTFDVSIEDAGPEDGRSIRIDGGEPFFLSRVSDVLAVGYAQTANVNHKPIGDGSGAVDALFASREFSIEYDGIETTQLFES